MTAAQDALIRRLRELLDEEPVTREVAMFGGRSFMVNGKLAVSALKDGGLLVRIAPENHAEFLSAPGASQAEMGTGRDMGPGWIAVTAESIDDDEHLMFWVDVALRFNRTIAGG
jgi:hypothetical protein